MLMFRFPWLLLILLLLPLPALAQAIDLYEGEAPVAGQGEAERSAALPAAFGQMLMRLTGDPDIAFDPAARGIVSEAPRLLQSYRYRQQMEVRDGLPQTRNWLVARFDPAQVDTALASAGIAVWLPPRPQPLVWLAIDDGSGARLLGSSQAGAVAALSASAMQRGLSLRFPAADSNEAGLVSAVLAGRTDELVAASERYSAPVLLIGTLQRSGAGWRVEWSALDAGLRIASRSGTNAQAAELLAMGGELLAGALAARYRIVSGGQLERFEVRVAGLQPPNDYARVMAYLQRLPGVQQVSPMQADGDVLRLQLQVAGGLQQLERLIRLGQLLEPSQAGAAEFILKQ